MKTNLALALWLLALCASPAATHTTIRVTPSHSLSQALADVPYLEEGTRATIVVSAGDYLIPTNTTTLLRDRVNWHFETGARLLSGNTSDTNSRAFFYDTSGAVTSSITGYGEFHISNTYSAVLIVTNPSSRVSFQYSAWTAATNIINPSGSVSVLGPADERTFYVHSSQSNKLASTIASAGPGSTIILGPGQFTLSADGIVMQDNQSIIGQGIGVTRINGAEGSESGIAMGHNCIIREMTIDMFGGGAVPITTDTSATNGLIDRIHAIGNTDTIIWQTTNGNLAFTARNFVSEGPYHHIVTSGTNTSLFRFVDSEFRGDMLKDTEAVNGSRNINSFTHSGGTLEITRCHVVISNPLTAEIIIASGTAPASPSFRISGLSYDVAVTNGGIFNPWSFGLYSVGSTNAFAGYSLTQPAHISTNALYWTNPPGPCVVSMTSTATRSNFLPHIGFLGRPRYPGLIVTVKDGANNAGSANVTVLPTGGATIDGAASFTISTNGGAVSFVTGGDGGTNWQILTR
jgi:hypothetical protein